MPPNVFSTILCFVALVYNSYDMILRIPLFLCSLSADHNKKISSPATPCCIIFFAVTSPGTVKQTETLSLQRAFTLTSLINVLFGRYLAKNDVLIITYSLWNSRFANMDFFTLESDENLSEVPSCSRHLASWDFRLAGQLLGTSYRMNYFRPTRPRAFLLNWESDFFKKDESRRYVIVSPYVSSLGVRWIKKKKKKKKK